jgi:sugar-specific transcriptional regulator TrmB
MMNNKNNVLQRLRTLNFDQEEATLYLELLKGASTHLKLARTTGINRTKVYRLVERLERRSLVSVRTDDRGTFVVASDPATLEVELITQEAKLYTQRIAFQNLLPALELVKRQDASNFIVNTYEGEEGFKQMLWHELKTKEEMLIFGSGTVKDLVAQPRWTKRLHELTIEAGFLIREILNPQAEEPFSLDKQYMDRFRHRLISPGVLSLTSQIVIYNNTVSAYHWRQGQKVGIEIVNEAYADMQRQIFNHYWALTGEKHHSIS